MDKDYDVYKELVATAPTSDANTKDLMHERKPLDFSEVENELGDEADSSTWTLV